MLHRRTYVTETRSEFIRLFEAMFSNISPEFYTEKNEPFFIIASGNYRTLKSLIALTGFYHLINEEHRTVNKLINQKYPNERLGIEEDFNTDLLGIIPAKIGWREIYLSFENFIGRADPDTIDWTKENKVSQMPNGGLSFISIINCDNEDFTEFSPLSIQLETFETQKDMADTVRDWKDIWSGKRLKRSWEETKISLPHNECFARITITVNDDYKFGRELIQNFGFSSFWNKTRGLWRPAPEPGDGKWG